MRGKIIDLTGQKFGRLTVIKMHDKRGTNNIIQWECQCNCGNKNIIIVTGNNLRSGCTRSCGCIKREILSKMKHSNNKNIYSNVPTNLPYRKKLFGVWKGIISRCYNEKDKHYKWYGEKDIKVCDEWLNKDNGFYNFYHWAIDNEYKEGLSIDRNNTNKNYEPLNCTWENQVEQCNNMTTNILITYKNKSLTAHQWKDELNLDLGFNIIRDRWCKGIRGKKLFEEIKPFTELLICIDGITKTAKEWYTDYNISHTQFKKRYEKGIRGKNLIKLTDKELGKDVINNISIYINKEKLTLKEIAIKYNLKIRTVKNRYLRGCTIEQIISHG